MCDMAGGVPCRVPSASRASLIKSPAAGRIRSSDHSASDNSLTRVTDWRFVWLFSGLFKYIIIACMYVWLSQIVYFLESASSAHTSLLHVFFDDEACISPAIILARRGQRWIEGEGFVASMVF